MVLHTCKQRDRDLVYQQQVSHWFVTFPTELSHYILETSLPQEYRREFPDLGDYKPATNWFASFFTRASKKSHDPVKAHRPSEMLSPSLLPGSSWCFPGHRAKIMIELAYRVPVTHISVDHAHPKVLPDKGTSAPKSMRVSLASL